MLASTSADARELRLFLENRLGGNDNVAHVDEQSDKRKKADASWEFTGRLTLVDDQGNLRYKVKYQPSYEQFFSLEGISGWDHNATADVAWQPTPADTLSLSGKFSQNRRIRQVFESAGLPADEPLQSDSTRTTRGVGSISYSRKFNPAWSGRFGYTLDTLDYNRGEISDYKTHRVSTGLDYAVDQRTTLGASLNTSFRNSKFNQTTGSPPTVLREVRSATNTVELSFLVQRQFSPTLSGAVRVGPSFVDTEQEQQFVAGGASRTYSNDVTVFANVFCKKELRRGSVDLAYSRFVSGGGDTSTSTIVDSLTLTTLYRFSQLWNVDVIGSWSQREAIADGVSLSNDGKTTLYRLIATLSRRLSDEIRIFARIQWHSQTREELAGDIDNENLIGWLAIQYNFDPIVF